MLPDTPPASVPREPIGSTALMACHACDLVHRQSLPLAPGRVRCVRCRAELYRSAGARIDTAIALALTAGVLLLLSNAYPLVALAINGSARATTMAGAALGLYRQGYAPMALLVIFTTLLVPAFQIGGLLYVLLPLRRRRRAAGQNRFFRMFIHARPWAMSEVFMLGSLVALVKLSALAEVVPGVALFAYGSLMLVLAALTGVTPPEQFWRWVEEAGA